MTRTLSSMMVEMMRADRARLVKMDTAKTAKHYGIPIEWVEYYRKMELQSR